MSHFVADQHQVIECARAPRWSPSARELDDLECLLLGGYPPLRGFLGPDDLATVAAAARLSDGTPWPVETTLTVPRRVSEASAASGVVVLVDEEGAPMGGVLVEQTWPVDSDRDGISGTVVQLGRIERGSHRWLRRPAADLPRPERLLGVPVERPLHAPQIAQVRALAATLGAETRLLPLTGVGRCGELDASALVRTCVAAARQLAADVVPVAVPHHEDRERDRWLIAVVAAAHGATHIPRDPRGTWKSGELGLPLAVDLPAVVRDVRTGAWAPEALVPPECRGPERVEEVEADVRRLIGRGVEVPSWLSPHAVVRELRRASPVCSGGFTILFTGLSGSGKSTIARALHTALLECSDRTVTLLDGDVARRMLSSELTFSRPHRELNVRRIGWVAAEVTRHGGIAVCAPIAPYHKSRAEVRDMVSRCGGFLLVHVATPLEECEARDRKGLYAKARAGILSEFTGVSDPYEVPEDADLVIDTTKLSVDEAVAELLTVVVGRGWLELSDAGPGR